MRTFLLIFALALLSPAADALEVFACEPEWGALARELGGADVQVYDATTALQDVHQIQPRPSLIAKFRQADLVVCTGAELEIGWLPPLIEKGNNPRVAPGAAGFFESSKWVTMLEVPATLDRAAGDVHPYGNPHLQTDPRNFTPIAQALAERLAALDPGHAAGYRARHARFAERWSVSVAKWQARAAPLQGKHAVSAHRSWSYLYRWLGIVEVAALEPKPGVPPSAAHLQDVVARLQRQPAQLVVFAAYQDRRPVEWLTERTGIAAVELPFTVGGAPGTDDLFGLFDVTLERLLAALAPRR